MNPALRHGLRKGSRFLPFAATLALGVGTSLMAVRTARKGREVERRAIEAFAAFAAWNYAFRVHSILENAGASLLVAIGPVERAVRGPDARRLTQTTDSVARCDCAWYVKARGFATARWGDSASVRYADTSGRALVADDPRMLRLTTMAALEPKTVRPVSFASGTAGARPWFLAIYPLRGATGLAEGFLALDVDLTDLRGRVLEEIFTSGGLLLPVDLTSVGRNAALASLRVETNTGVQLYASDSTFRSGYGGTSVAVRDTTLRVHVELSPAAVHGLFQTTLPRRDMWSDALLPLLSLLLLAAVGLTTYRAQRLATLRSDFTASVTHELRTPLTQILLNAETLTLDRVRSEPDRRKVLNVVVREARRLVYLIDNVMHFSRADKRLLRLRPRPTRVDVLASELVESLQILADASGTTLEVCAPDAATAMADPDGLHLALTNLVDNALHYAPGGVIRISVHVTASEVLLLVDDAGPGVPVRDRRRVQQPFLRLPAAAAGHPTGSGIGLAVVREVMTAMHGALELDTSPAGGLRARLRLPAAPRPAAA